MSGELTTLVQKNLAIDQTSINSVKKNQIIDSMENEKKVSCTQKFEKSVKSKMTNDMTSKLLEQTKFTEQELKQWHKGFMKDCPSGKLTKEEFGSIYRQFFPQGR